MSLIRLLFAFLAALSCAHAQDAPPRRQVWLNPGFFSWHFDRDQNFNEKNWGVGVEVVFAPDHAVMAGIFNNSERERSRYAAYQWRPLHWQPHGINVSAGIALGAFDGYPKNNDGGWFVAPLPVLAIEGERFGVNFGIVPTIQEKVHGAVILQLKLRVW